MSSVSRLCSWSACTAIVLASWSLAHDGDGKLRDRRPRVEASHFGTNGDLALSADSMGFAASGVQLMSWIPLRDFGLEHVSGNSCTGYTSPSGREYALVGLSNGTGFVEITDPGNPTIVAVVAGNASLWRDVRTYQQWAYMVTENMGGIQVANLTQINSGIVTLTNTILSGGPTQTHTVCINPQSGYLYRSGGAQNGLRIYSLSNPGNPTYVAQWQDRYVHEVTVTTYTSGPYAGREIAFCCSGFNNGLDQPGIDILDVTNKSNIFLIKRYFYPDAVFSHQGWLSSNKQYFYLNDELDDDGTNLTKTKVINVQNLSNPMQVAQFGNGLKSIDHNLHVLGNRIYESNYTTGLRVFDNTNMTAPTEVAWFDTYPEDNGATFNGLWNNYPFFASGTVIGSDLERGLFVWFVGAPTVDIELVDGFPDAIDPANGVVHLTLTSTSLMPGSGKLHYDAGQGWVKVDLVHQGASAYDAQFPPIECGKDVAWYVTARSNNGFTWSYPQGAPTIVAHSTAGNSSTYHIAEQMELGAPDWDGHLPGDTAGYGKWTLADPSGSPAQPEEDHTGGTGSYCWVTSNADDVDGGFTTLLSRQYSVANAVNPVVRYWRWFSTNQGPPPLNEDVFQVDISDDNGQTWINVETIGPGGPGTSGGWILHQFKVSDYVATTGGIRLRFIASDYGNPSTVEAAIDDFAILDIGCTPGPAIYCTAKVNSQGCTPAIDFAGQPSASVAVPFTIGASQVLSNKAGLLLYGFGQADVPFQGGTLCLAQPFKRTPVQNSLGNPGPVDCSGTYSFDFNAFVQAGTDPALLPGTTVDGQYYYRDPPDAFGSGLTDAVHFTIAP